MSDKLHKLLNELKQSLDEFARINDTRSADAAGTWSADQVRIHFEFVRYDVQVARESAVEQLHTLARELLLRVDEAERDCLAKYERIERESAETRANASRIAAFVNEQANELLKSYATGAHPDTDTNLAHSIDVAESYKRQLATSSEHLRNALLLANQQASFRACDLELLTGADLLGELEFTPTPRERPFALDFVRQLTVVEWKSAPPLRCLWPTSDGDRFFALSYEHCECDGAGARQCTTSNVCCYDRLGRCVAAHRLDYAVEAACVACTIDSELVICLPHSIVVLNTSLNVSRRLDKQKHVQHVSRVCCNRTRIFCLESLSSAQTCSVHVYALDDLRAVTSVSLEHVLTGGVEHMFATEQKLLVVDDSGCVTRMKLMTSGGGAGGGGDSEELTPVKGVPMALRERQIRPLVFHYGTFLVQVDEERRQLVWHDDESGVELLRTEATNQPEHIAAVHQSPTSVVFYDREHAKFYLLKCSP